MEGRGHGTAVWLVPEGWSLERLAQSLRAWHVRTARAFGVRPDPDFLPHLSLVYGRLDAGAKERIAASVASDLATAFEATTLEVWRTEGPVAEWSRRGRFALRGP